MNEAKPPLKSAHKQATNSANCSPLNNAQIVFYKLWQVTKKWWCGKYDRKRNRKQCL